MYFRLYRHFDDGTNAWESLKEIYNPQSIPLDVSHARSWGLLHYGGSYTYPHHDASGLGTIVVARSGLKIWSVMRPVGYEIMKTRREINNAIGTLLDEKEEEKDRESSRWVEYAIYAKAGDIMYVPSLYATASHLIQLRIQPPGQWHQVYTPIRSVTTGGHFISYDTLHFMEQSMRIDKRLNNVLTNNGHDVYTTLVMLAARLPHLNNRCTSFQCL